MDMGYNNYNTYSKCAYFVSSLKVAAFDEACSTDIKELGVYSTVAERFRVLPLVVCNSSSNTDLSTFLYLIFYLNMAYTISN